MKIILFPLFRTVAVVCSRKKWPCGQKYDRFEPDEMALHPVASRKGVINPMSAANVEDMEKMEQLEKMEEHHENTEDHHDRIRINN